MILGGPLAAAPKVTFDPAAPSYVDIHQLLSQYRKTSAFTKYQTRIREQAKKFAQEMELLAKVRHCSEPERQEALVLNEKPKLEKKEQTRFDELLKKSDLVDKELATLGQKEKPTDQEAKRISELSKQRQDAIRLLAKEEADRRDRIRDLEDELMAEVETELLKFVQQVAKDKKVPYVYSRQAVLVGGNDLTEEVAKKLPK